MKIYNLAKILTGKVNNNKILNKNKQKLRKI